MLGTTIAGRYRLKQPIGSGGMGTVWRAEDLDQNFDVAIKVIPVGDPVREATFYREAQVAARLSHPNVVAIRDHGSADLDGGRNFFLVMDLVEGVPLSTLTGRPLPVVQTLAWAIQVSRALEAAHHRGIVHRDLKPANVLIDQTANVIAKLCDFGIARIARPGEMANHTLTVTGVAIGTPAYMSPEQARGDTTLGTPSDLYSFGCLLHELLTGSAPFTGTSWEVLNQHVHGAPAPLSALRPGSPRELEQLTLDLLDKDPDCRPTAAATTARLTQLHAALVASADAPTATAPAHPPPLVAGTRPVSRRPATGSRRATACAATLTAAGVTGILTSATAMPVSWTVSLGALAGGMLAALYLLDPPQPPHTRELKITTAALTTYLLLTTGAALAVLVTGFSRWPAALAISILGGPAMAACASAVRRLVEHTLRRAPRHSDLATTVGALHTLTVLLAFNDAGLPRLAFVAAVLWPVAALLTAALTPNRTRHTPYAPVRSSTSELTGVTPPRSAVTHT
ncbi:protein kinase [Streptomyces sp. NPDC059611]|uniref:serine/threonine-protein kinase n=1 Tax=Streptomyces sp. NPDC059611 TaxID=3346884 RepID=UPI00368186E0